ncbi:MAG: hypothetical protein GY742_17175 [Hyphomicrobiales bacterium]|nr:hypothetical protein [Hyphomicrobiales bacterium]
MNTFLPTRQAWQTFLKYGIVIDVMFLTIYGGCNYVSSQRSDIHQFYFDWELNIPFIPMMIWPYLTLFPLLLVPLFRLPHLAMPRLGCQLITSLLIAGCIFLAFPAKLGHQLTAPEVWYKALFSFLYIVDQPYNLVPSLHVIFCSLILWALMEQSRVIEKYFYAIWLAVVTISVILVHQHHLVDVAGGFVVAGLCKVLFSAQETS